MCTIIVTIRTVLWAVMTIAGSLMILVSLFTNQWLIGRFRIPSSGVDVVDGFLKGINTITDSADINLQNTYGIFLDCKKPEGNLIFEGECVPNLKVLEDQMFSEDEAVYPKAWKGGIACFVVGLAIMILTVGLSLLTPCCRKCICCSVFTICGSLQVFAALLFILGLIAYPAGWGSPKVKAICGESAPFFAADCQIGGAYWLAVAGTVCTSLASTLSAFAYRSTKSTKTMYRMQDGDKFICVP